VVGVPYVFPFRNNIYHNPGEYSKLCVVIHFMVVVKVVIIEVRDDPKVSDDSGKVSK